MGWFDKFKAGLNVANAVTMVLPVPSWAKKTTEVAHVGVSAYELDRRAPDPSGKLPADFPVLTYEPGAESVLIIQLPGENFVRQIRFGELALLVLTSKIKKKDSKKK